MTTPTTPPTAPRITREQLAAFRSVLGGARPEDLSTADALGMIDLLGRKLAATREGRGGA